MSMEHLWPGMSMGYLWDIYGIFMEHLWNIYGTSMGYLWNIYGTSAEEMKVPKPWRYPQIIQIIKVDHDLVLKPTVTIGAHDLRQP